ncbi:hypothetical protein NLM25_12630 [Bradyrhizobium sp. CCGB01]|nr:MULTISPECIES: hypothetical protein [unclassified Bradyrhizobium]MCP3397798.1 hypothetical protein [Bradyrhizobium sp. CCGB20]MCP3406387.1 hypothetical protein [Bradyrhizobium sp. CCGB01]
MATQIVMDHRRQQTLLRANRSKRLAEAEWRLKKLIDQGFTAAMRMATGDLNVVRTFDPTAEETLSYPRLVSG